MTKEQHTPGPWKIIPGTFLGPGGTEISSVYNVDRIPIEDGLGVEYCTIVSDHTTSDMGEWRRQKTANAHLIAAAPELLEALIWMVENDDTYEGDAPLPDHSGATWNEINAFWIAGINKARAAIAKARGQS